MKTLNAIAIFAISVAGVVHAQDAGPDARRQAAVEAKQQFVGAASPDVATSCTYNFTSGTGNKFMKYCVTKNGNIAQFESPAGAKYISTSPVGEGYAFCDFDSRVQYSDYAGFGDSGNWQPPVTTSSSPTVVKISRTSSDGIYTLNQVITQNAGNAYAQVAMTLKNNSANPHHVGLLRWADVDAGGSPIEQFRLHVPYGDGVPAVQQRVRDPVRLGWAIQWCVFADHPGRPGCLPDLHARGRSVSQYGWLDLRTVGPATGRACARPSQ